MKRWLSVVVLAMVILVGCGATPNDAAPGEATPEAPVLLRVMSYGSFDISEEVIARFEQEQGVSVQFLDAGDTGQMVSQAILSRDNPQADVLYGVDNTFLSRALEADIFVPYQAEALDQVSNAFVLDDQYRVTPVDYGDVCLNYDRAYFEENDIAIPASLEDLTRPEYAGLLVVQNPASSSPGLAFLLATIEAFGEDAYLDYWQALRANDLLVVDSWDNAYYGEFSGASGGEGTRPMVVSYATSPAAEVYYSGGAIETPPTGAVTAPGTCFRQIEFVGILRNNQNQAMAEAFVEYVLGDAFQSDIPLHMWVFPVNETVTLPEVFEDYAVHAEEPATMAVERIEANRESWITAWTEVVLR
jgi:thiamine transport system substrate-binding protein